MDNGAVAAKSLSLIGPPGSGANTPHPSCDHQWVCRVAVSTAPLRLFQLSLAKMNVLREIHSPACHICRLTLIFSAVKVPSAANDDALARTFRQ